MAAATTAPPPTAQQQEVHDPAQLGLHQLRTGVPLQQQQPGVRPPVRPARDPDRPLARSSHGLPRPAAGRRRQGIMQGGARVASLRQRRLGAADRLGGGLRQLHGPAARRRLRLRCRRRAFCCHCDADFFDGPGAGDLQTVRTVPDMAALERECCPPAGAFCQSSGSDADTMVPARPATPASGVKCEGGGGGAAEAASDGSDATQVASCFMRTRRGGSPTASGDSASTPVVLSATQRCAASLMPPISGGCMAGAPQRRCRLSAWSAEARCSIAFVHEAQHGGRPFWPGSRPALYASSSSALTKRPLMPAAHETTQHVGRRHRDANWLDGGRHGCFCVSRHSAAQLGTLVLSVWLQASVSNTACQLLHTPALKETYKRR